MMPRTRLPQTISRQVEVIHTSLGGLALIALVLLAGLLLPVFGFNPVSSEMAAGLITVVACIGIGHLYLLNYRAHKLVLEQARLTDVLLNSLGQGFLTFDEKGICGNVHSQACLPLLKITETGGKNIAELLRVPPLERAEFAEWLGVLFMPGHALSFDDAVRFLPDHLDRPDGTSIELHYKPVRDKTGRLHRIVLIATDRTEEKAAQKRIDTERQFVAMICAIFAEKQSFYLTLKEIKSVITRLARLESNIFEEDFFRDVHTVKSAAMHFKMETLGEKLHALESTLRACADEIEKPIEDVAQHRSEIQLEFGRIQNALRGILDEEDGQIQGVIEVDEDSIYHFGKLLRQHKVSPDLFHVYQSTIMSVPLFALLKSLDRQILPLAEKLEKKIKPLVFKGENVRMPAKPLQRLLMTLTHVVHNIVDHGIEAPMTRLAKGKDPQGTVTITVGHAVGDDAHKWVEIRISDDGAGIDPNRVRQKLMETDPEGTWRFDDDRAIVQQLLTRALSTRDEVNMFSGRGAGMSAVYEEVVRLGGQAELRSEMHHGTELVIRLPERLETLSE